MAWVRRSFHGPLVTAPARVPRPAARALELVPSSPSDGRAVLQAARGEAPRADSRERVLAGVLAALRGLTSAG